MKRLVATGERSLPGSSRSRLRFRDLVAEALAGMTQRPGRSVLTMAGTILGVGAAVAVLGITSTASGQISQAFSVLKATTVTVQVGTSPGFPATADAAVDALPGVRSAGSWWQMSGIKGLTMSTRAGAVPGSGDDFGQNTPFFAATPGLFAAAQARMSSGATFNKAQDDTGQYVCVIGPAVADTTGAGTGSTIFIDDIPFYVTGVLSSMNANQEMLLGLTIPSRTAIALFGTHTSNGGPQMLIRTRLGAADEVASEAPTAISPYRPGEYHATAPPNPTTLGTSVNGALAGLHLALGGVSLLIGALGIANTTLVSVIERRTEIGLRRAFGAMPRHIAAQFLAESTLLGLLGGLIGTALAVAVIVGVAVAQHWTAIVNPALVVGAPALGAVTGLMAGIYPALRSALIEPLSAIRTG